MAPYGTPDAVLEPKRLRMGWPKAHTARFRNGCLKAKSGSPLTEAVCPLPPASGTREVFSV